MTFRFQYLFLSKKLFKVMNLSVDTVILSNCVQVQLNQISVTAAQNVLRIKLGNVTREWDPPALTYSFAMIATMAKISEVP